MKKKRILIINDNSSLLKQLKRHLICDGYDVEITASGNKGVKLFDKNKFDLILIDYHLKNDKSITAELFIPRLKAINSSVPIILMSATEENLPSPKLNVNDFIYLDDDFWNKLSGCIKKYLSN